MTFGTTLIFHRCPCRKRIKSPAEKPYEDCRISEIKQGRSDFWQVFKFWTPPESGISKHVTTKIDYISFCKFWIYFIRRSAVPSLRLFAGNLPLWRNLDYRVVNVGFMAEKVALKHGFLLILRVYLHSISARMLDTHLFTYKGSNVFLAKKSLVIHTYIYTYIYLTLKLSDRGNWLKL